MDSAYWQRECEKRRALWKHDGNPKHPHIFDHTGRHTNVFFDIARVMEDPAFLDETCFFLWRQLNQHGLEPGAVDRVVGPIESGSMVHDLARHIGHVRRQPCLRSHAETQFEGQWQRHMVFRVSRITPGERILLVHGTLRRGEMELLEDAVTEKEGIPVPFAATLVNSTGLSEVCGKKIIALMHGEIASWEEDECQLCRQGSQAVWPDHHWPLLTATY